eukprot:GILJ01006654.1.p1 GENE.GILJ01006654.1~~GILJ01006654.1.p1  ORF type:complete len:180 (+),score=19.01 GILJ01006654.1:696-1235(+)
MEQRQRMPTLFFAMESILRQARLVKTLVGVQHVFLIYAPEFMRPNRFISVQIILLRDRFHAVLVFAEPEDMTSQYSSLVLSADIPDDLAACQSFVYQSSTSELSDDFSYVEGPIGCNPEAPASRRTRSTSAAHVVLEPFLHFSQMAVKDPVIASRLNENLLCVTVAYFSEPGVKNLSSR